MLGVLAILASCAIQSPDAFAALSEQAMSDTMVEKLSPSIGCAAFEDDFFDSLTEQLTQQGSLPSQNSFRASLIEVLKSSRFQPLSERERIQLVTNLSDLYQVATVDTLNTNITASAELSEKVAAIAAAEIGDRTTPEKMLLQNNLHTQLKVTETFSNGLHLACARAPERQKAQNLPSNSFVGFLQGKHTPAVYGALKAMATAYQSCDVATQRPLDKDTPNAAGIQIFGTAPDGIGRKRRISDLKALDATDPYLKNYHKPQGACFDILQSPLIYNYGGKPAVIGNDLNFFQHGGSGTSTLGVDCSGYIYTALAAAGLKVRKSGRLKASSVNGVSAHMYMNPQSNGLTCFNYPSFNAQMSIQSGDILASSGHVIMIESIGADPFGIAAIHDEKDCTLANMSVARFNFDIVQSAPVKGDIGINRYRIADYIGVEPDMSKALLHDAVSACLARVRNATVQTKATSAGLVRHEESADCSDTPLHLTHESCLDQCQSN